jgi:hypothetical protein
VVAIDVLPRLHVLVARLDAREARLDQRDGLAPARVEAREVGGRAVIEFHMMNPA